MRTQGTALKRYTLWGLLALVVYLLQSASPALLPAPWGIVPVPLLPLVVVVTLRERELAGALFGLACGLLMDVTATSLPGLHALLFLTVGCVCGLLGSRLFNDTLRAALTMGLPAAALYALVHWLAVCRPWQLPGAGSLLAGRYLPLAVYTALFLVPLYYLIRWMDRRMERRRATETD